MTPSGPLPDLRSLPARGIISDGRYLDSCATVWNAGPGRLVVDGFRDPEDDDLTHAHPYFFTTSGHQKGHAPVGGMEWDARGDQAHRQGVRRGSAVRVPGTRTAARPRRTSGRADDGPGENPVASRRSGENALRDDRARPPAALRATA